ncbi:MAG: protein kinase [Chloroflexota bacterium]|nr:protein kinase [Chloroflexota bacterium]
MLAFRDATLEIDVTDLLPQIRVPTLVICRPSRQYAQPKSSQLLASRIPEARLAVLESWTGTGIDEEWLRVIGEFLGDVAPASPPEAFGEVTRVTSSAPQSFAAGRYTVRRVLGEGGQKVVYLVHDEALDRDCALSMVKSELLETDDLERLRREAQAMARLGAHSNIVTVHDIGDEGGKPYLVCEYVPAGELRRHLRDAAAPLPLERALAIAADIARALAVAHGRGVIHRDVKPANVWLCDDGSAKLGDFGLAFSIDRTRMTIAGTVMGTATYMAPEQARGDPADARTDLYALGVMLYEMVCGRPPFLGDDPLSVISQHANVAPVAPATHAAGLPLALDDLILRLLAKPPAERPASAAVVLEELRAISEGLRTPNAPPELEEPEPEPMAPVPGFVGRAPEQEQLAAALDRAIEGAGSLVMVVGEPGIGKTRLLEQFAAHARTAGALVLVGRCYDGDWAPPFSPFVEAIKQHATHTPQQRLRAQLGNDAGVLARIVPALHERLPNIAEPPAIPAEGERYRLLEAVSDTLGRLAAKRPLVLVLDDLHWADKGTIAMLQQVARTSATQPILVLGAYRDVELDRTYPLADALAGLRREKNFERIALRGLDGAEVAELLDAIAEQDVPAALSEAIARETDGNPFFIKEVLLHLVEEKKIVQQDGTWTSKLSIAEMGIPEGVREVIGRRLSRVSETCGRMLTVASALTAGFSWEAISAICDAGDTALLDAVDEALGAQLIVERERGRYDFTHALIRHTLYEELSTPRRVLLHRQIGEALERLYVADLSAHVGELAHHFYEADAGTGGEKAISLCEAAGDAALRSLAYDEGVVQFERAVFLLGAAATKDERRRIGMMLKVAGTRFAAGIHSIDVFIAAAERARDAGEWDLMMRAVLRDPFPAGRGVYSSTIWPTDSERIGPLLDEAVAHLPPGANGLRACALAQRSALAGNSTGETAHRVAEASALAREAEAIARELDDPLVLMYVLYWTQWALWAELRGRGRQLQAATELLELASNSGNRPMVRTAHMWRAHCLMSVGDPAMDEDLEIFYRTAAEYRIRVLSWWSTTCVVNRKLITGEFAEAERLMAICLSYAPPPIAGESPEIGDNADVTTSFAYQLFSLRNSQGRLAEIEPLVRNAVEQSPDFPALRAALGLGFAQTDRLDEAHLTIEPLLSMGVAGLRDDPNFDATLPLLAETCAAIGEQVAAPELYEALLSCEHLMLCTGWRVPFGSADRLLGLLAALMGRRDDAARHFESAIEIEKRFGARPWVARTQLDYARMLRKRDAAGDAARARELLQQALATAQEIGMAKVAADCEALLASAP